VSTEDGGRELAGAGRAVRWSCFRCVVGYVVFNGAGAPSGPALPRPRNVVMSFALVTSHEDVWESSVLYKLGYSNQQYVRLHSASHGKLLSYLVMMCEG